ncbi:alpha-1,3 mannosyltransferase [Histoplasma capsulatum var. duboisii H88]|uniref:Alpha-1,3 mannosyltransferase n=2 Tax=Ajellomyces capsulatus TaxID=5037 RepID=F0UP96_AJEC8|nr:alpha-1,3-mannosyltransferase [Histoplasma capsulatum H143]EGC47748.1 alpha-1,3 mannosyltransferase [Histoplasma capsulatum var. duboisii H88]
MAVLLRHSGLVGNMLGIHSMHFANGKRALLGRLSASEDDERPPPDNEIALQPEHQNGSQTSLEGDEKKPKSYTIWAPAPHYGSMDDF